MEAVSEWQKSNNFETRLREISSDLSVVYLFIPHETAWAFGAAFSPCLQEGASVMMYYEIIFKK